VMLVVARRDACPEIAIVDVHRANRTAEDPVAQIYIGPAAPARRIQGGLAAGRRVLGR
jgi:hypothetical protein